MTNRTVKVVVKGDVSDFNRAMLAAAASSKAFSNSLDSSRNQMSGLIQAGLALAPALAPIGAAAIPVVTGLANQLGFAAGAAAVTTVAFKGVGKALGDLNDYRLKPTGENLANLQNSMAAISPAGRDLVNFLQDLRPEFSGLQDIAQEGMFPGVQQGITELLKNGPLIEQFFRTVSATVGDLFAEGGDNLNDPRWQAFFEFLNREAKPTLEAMARTLGNFTDGLAQMWMAFEPANDRFSAGFLNMSRDFAEWAGGLSTSGGFQDFLAYLERTGPMVSDALGSISNALVETAKALAVVGDVALPVLTLMFDAFAGLMSSPIGPTLLGIAAALGAISTAMRVARFSNLTAVGAGIGVLRDLPALGRGALVAKRDFLDFGKGLDNFGGNVVRASTATQKLGSALAKGGKIGAGAAGLAFVMSDLDDKMGLTNATSFALAGGLLSGTGLGAALGFAVGATVDLAHANDDLHDAVKRAADAAGNSSVSYDAQAAALDVAKRKLEELTRAENSLRSPGGSGGLSLGDRIKGGKSLVEGMFGKSDSEEAAAAIRQIEKATADQKFAELGMTDVMGGATQSIRDHTEALYDDIAAKRASVSETLGSIGGEIAWEAAIDSATQTIRENGKATNINSEAGRANVGAIHNMIDAWNSLTPAGQAARGGMDAARKAIYDAARAAGFGKKKARELVDMLIDLDGIDPSVKVDVETAAAIRKLQGLQRKINGMRGRTIGIHIQSSYGGGTKTADADGSVKDYFGMGGFHENHVAQIAPANTIRMWAEPETGGEAYIPLAASKRDRSIDIWTETGRRLGVMANYANGGFGIGPLRPAETSRNGGSPLAQRDLARAVTEGIHGATFQIAADGRSLQVRMRGV